MQLLYELIKQNKCSMLIVTCIKGQYMSPVWEKMGKILINENLATISVDTISAQIFFYLIKTQEKLNKGSTIL